MYNTLYNSELIFFYFNFYSEFCYEVHKMNRFYSQFEYKCNMKEILIYRAIGTKEKEFTAEQFVDHLGWLEKEPDITELKLRFNSPGGSVFEGFAIISKMEETPLKITGVIDGIAASMAAFIALRCDYLKMNRNAKLMLHLPTTSANGDADSLRAIADKLDDLKNRFAEIVAQKAGITNQQAIELYLQPGKDVWLTATEAKAAGLVDEVIGEPAEIPAAANATEYYEIYAKLIDTKIKSDMNKEKLIAVLGTQANAEMTEDEVIAMVENVVKEHTDNLERITALEAKVTAFETEKAEARESEITALLDNAVSEKRITAQQRDAWKGMFDKDFDNAKALLKSLNPAPSVKGNLNEDEPTEAELKAEWEKADREGTLAKIKVEDPERFEAMRKARFAK